MENSIQEGALFYGKQQRRTNVSFDSELRDLTLEIAQKTRAMIDSTITPRASYSARLCDRCSLIKLCQPKSMRLKRGVSNWFENQLKS